MVSIPANDQRPRPSVKVRAMAYDPPLISLCFASPIMLQERKGSRVAVNHGKGGIAISGYFIGPIKFERPGPIANDPLNRAVLLQPAAQCHIDTKNTGKLLAPMQSHLAFSMEVWAKCEGGLDTTRYLLMTGRWVSFGVCAPATNQSHLRHTATRKSVPLIPIISPATDHFSCYGEQVLSSSNTRELLGGLDLHGRWL